MELLIYSGTWPFEHVFDIGLRAMNNFSFLLDLELQQKLSLATLSF